MFGWLARALEFFYSIIPSYAAAITLLTVAVMLLLYPLTAKGTRSMLAMQRIQPELKRLQQLHKDDRVTLNQETMALYKKHGVNPFSSCLPLLLQAPVFFILFKVFSGLTSVVVAGAVVAGGSGSTKALEDAEIVRPKIENVKAAIYNSDRDGSSNNPRMLELSRARGLRIKADVEVDGKKVGSLSDGRIVNGVIVGKESNQPVKVVDEDGETVGTIQGARLEEGRIEARPSYVSSGSELGRDLRETPGRMESFGIDFAKGAKDPHDSLAAASPYWGLLILMVATQYVQQWQLTRRNKNANSSPQARQMQQIQKFFPPFFGYISIGFPAGVVLYWTVSNIFRVGQQFVINKFDPRISEMAEELREDVDAQIEIDKKKASHKPQQKKRKKKGR